MFVSVIVPVFNEEHYIEQVLRGLFNQDWAEPFEVLIVDGDSTDETVARVEDMIPLAPREVSVRVLRNPHRHIPRALNIAVKAARGQVLVRMDGHTVPPRDLISRSVHALQSAGVPSVVGGRTRIRAGARGIMAEAIARAVAHPFGTGNVAYRSYVPTEGERTRLIPVDTVPFGSFKREVWEEIGGYDEQLLTAEDYDFAFRARKRGYPILLDPGLVIDYFSRPTLSALAKQYFRYGHWTSRLLKKHRQIPAIRKLVPFGLVTSTLTLVVIRPMLGVLWAALYVGSLAGVLLWDSLREGYPLRQVVHMLLALIVLHWAYGIGNCSGLFGEGRVDYGSY